MGDNLNVGSGSFAGKNFIGPRPGSVCPNGSINLTANIPWNNYQWQLSTDSANFNNLTDNATYAGSDKQILQLTNLPSTWYWYQYRCIVNGVTDAAASVRFQNYWLGTYGPEWENNNNWACKTIPDHNTDVIINQGAANVISNTLIRSLKINPAAKITINAGATLGITN